MGPELLQRKLPLRVPTVVLPSSDLSLSKIIMVPLDNKGQIFGGKLERSNFLPVSPNAAWSLVRPNLVLISCEAVTETMASSAKCLVCSRSWKKAKWLKPVDPVNKNHKD